MIYMHMSCEFRVDYNKSSFWYMSYKISQTAICFINNLLCILVVVQRYRSNITDSNKSSFWYMSYKISLTAILSAVHTGCSKGTDLTLQTATPSGTVNCGCVQSLRVVCGGCVSL